MLDAVDLVMVRLDRTVGAVDEIPRRGRQVGVVEDGFILGLDDILATLDLIDHGQWRASGAVITAELSVNICNLWRQLLP